MFHFHVSICTCSTIYITTNTDVILGWGAMSATLPGQVSAEKMRALKAQTVPTEAFKKFEKKRKQALEDIEQNRKETAAQLRRVGEVLRNNADSKDESGKRPPKTGSAKDEKTKNKSGEKQKEKVAKMKTMRRTRSQVRRPALRRMRRQRRNLRRSRRRKRQRRNPQSQARRRSHMRRQDLQRIRR